MNKLILFIVLSILFLTNCAPNMDLTNPNKVTTGNYYTDAQKMEFSVNASYNMLQRSGCFSRRLYFMLNAKSGDWDYTRKASAGMKEVPPLVNFTITGSNENVTQSWTALYAMVYASNLALEKIEENKTVSLSVKDRLLGEAYFLRGFSYFTLAQLYGEEIPYIDKVPQSLDQFYPSNSLPGIVYSRIVSDFEKAIDLLPTRSVMYSFADNIGRATKGAAMGYLARAYLYRPIIQKGKQANWSGAEELLRLLIQSGEYELMDNYRCNHTAEFENNKESLFEVQFLDAYPDQDFGGDEDWIASPTSRSDAVTWRQRELGMYDNINGSWWNLAPSPYMVAEYEEKDPRKEMSLWMDGGAKYRVKYRGKDTWITYNEWFTKAGNVQRPPVGEKVYGCRKYCTDHITPAQDSDINERLFRYSDVLLMYAECLIELGRETEADAYIDQVRKRANNKLLPSDADRHLYYTQVGGSLAMTASVLSQKPLVNGKMIDTRRRLIKHERMVEFFGEGLYYFDLLRWNYNSNDPDALTILDNIKSRGFVSGRNEFYPYPSTELDANHNLHGNQAN